jgi:hypothetical protein
MQALILLELLHLAKPSLTSTLWTVWALSVPLVVAIVVASALQHWIGLMLRNKYLREYRGGTFYNPLLSSSSSLWPHFSRPFLSSSSFALFPAANHQDGRVTSHPGQDWPAHLLRDVRFIWIHDMGPTDGCRRDRVGVDVCHARP